VNPETGPNSSGVIHHRWKTATKWRGRLRNRQPEKLKLLSEAAPVVLVGSTEASRQYAS
jgi:hypothetical protein